MFVDEVGAGFGCLFPVLREMFEKFFLAFPAYEDDVTFVIVYVFDGLGREDVFRIPGNVAGARFRDFFAWGKIVHGASGVENGTGAVIAVEKDGSIFSIMRFQIFGDGFSGKFPHIIRYDKEPEHRVDGKDGNGCQEDEFFTGLPPEACRQYRESKEVGIGVCEVFRRKKIEDDEDGQCPNDEKPRRIAHAGEAESLFGVLFPK